MRSSFTLYEVSTQANQSNLLSFRCWLSAQSESAFHAQSSVYLRHKSSGQLQSPQGNNLSHLWHAQRHADSGDLETGDGTTPLPPTPADIISCNASPGMNAVQLLNNLLDGGKVGLLGPPPHKMTARHLCSGVWMIENVTCSFSSSSSPPGASGCCCSGPRCLAEGSRQSMAPLNPQPHHGAGSRGQ